MLPLRIVIFILFEIIRLLSTHHYRYSYYRAVVKDGLYPNIVFKELVNVASKQEHREPGGWILIIIIIRFIAIVIVRIVASAWKYCVMNWNSRWRFISSIWWSCREVDVFGAPGDNKTIVNPGESALSFFFQYHRHRQGSSPALEKEYNTVRSKWNPSWFWRSISPIWWWWKGSLTFLTYVVVTQGFKNTLVLFNSESYPRFSSGFNIALIIITN